MRGRSYDYMHNVPIPFLLHIANLSVSGRGYFLALPAAGHAGGTPVHYTETWAPAGLLALRSRRSTSL